MQIPLRILRTHVDDLPGARPRLSAKELDRKDRILDTARSLIARYGRGNITFNSLAIAMRLAPATIRRLFPCLDTILSDLITTHLLAILHAMAQIPLTHPNRGAAQRAAYVDFTRNCQSACESHVLLTRERHALPPDLLEHIEKCRDLIGNTLLSGHPETILCLLDNPYLHPPQIEAILVALVKPEAAALKPIIIAKHERKPNQKFKAGFHPKTPPQARAGPPH
jgi:AcrR family transcriptional regulator